MLQVVLTQTDQFGRAGYRGPQPHIHYTPLVSHPGDLREPAVPKKGFTDIGHFGKMPAQVHDTTVFPQPGALSAGISKTNQSHGLYSLVA